MNMHQNANQHNDVIHLPPFFFVRRVIQAIPTTLVSFFYQTLPSSRPFKIRIHGGFKTYNTIPLQQDIYVHEKGVFYQSLVVLNFLFHPFWPLCGISVLYHAWLYFLANNMHLKFLLSLISYVVWIATARFYIMDGYVVRAMHTCALLLIYFFLSSARNG